MIQDDLRSRFELQGMTIAELPEKIESQIIQAGQMLAEALLAEKKVICIGLNDTEPVANHVSTELTNSSQLERPPLPSLSIQGSSNPEEISRQLKSLGSQGDILILFQGSGSHTEDHKTVSLCQEAEQLKIKSILIGNSDFPIPNSGQNLQLIIDKGSRMNYLCSITVIGLTLAALMDHQLFGHPL